MRAATGEQGRMSDCPEAPSSPAWATPGSSPGTGISSAGENNPRRALQPGRAGRAPSLRPPVLSLFRPDKRLFGACSGPVKTPVPKPARVRNRGLQSRQPIEIAGLSRSARRPRGKKPPASRRPDRRRRTPGRNAFAPDLFRPRPSPPRPPPRLGRAAPCRRTSPCRRRTSGRRTRRARPRPRCCRRASA